MNEKTKPLTAETLPDHIGGPPTFVISMTSEDTQTTDGVPLPWVDFADFRADPGLLVGARETVLDHSRASLLIRDGVSPPALRRLRADAEAGFTRAELMQAVIAAFDSVIAASNQGGDDAARPTYHVSLGNIGDLGLRKLAVYLDDDGKAWLLPELES